MKKIHHRLDLLDPLLDFEDPFERLEPEDVDRAGDERREPELDLVTLGVLLDLLFPEGLYRVTDDFLVPELDLVTPGFLLFDDFFRVIEVLFPEFDLLPFDRRVLYVFFVFDLLLFGSLDFI